MRASILAALLAAPLLLAAGDAEAWTGLQDAPHPFWGLMPVKYYINEGTFPPGIAATGKQRLEAGFGVWSAPDCSAWATQNLGNLPDGKWSSGDDKNVLLWVNAPDPWPLELGDVNSVIGVTLPIWMGDSDGNQLIFDADIVFNGVGFCWYNYDPQNPAEKCSGGEPVDTLSIAAHEQGHFLGLGHTDVQNSTMWPSYLGGNTQATIEQDDVDGVCALYPKGGVKLCGPCKQNAAKNQCAEQSFACTGQCIGVYNCVLQCATPGAACIDQCTEQYPEGAEKYLAYANCICNSCSAECGPECSGVGSGSGGATEASGAWNGDGEPEGPELSEDGGCGCSVYESPGHVGALGALAAALAVLARRSRRRS
ncbi:matrixin family metalloprotease [Polyangium aurulentum]|uniref:matrixin family metalloprotease n=1 Tax=Polyangium aurulentum TaxID=2567896 RepID=UPI0010AE38C5|nr:matrixin family metalloprotease [Polyangium aurulentum]UQA55732.1 matrixin family metalloprotease [Polyangium aurulentum]